MTEFTATSEQCAMRDPVGAVVNRNVCAPEIDTVIDQGAAPTIRKIDMTRHRDMLLQAISVARQSREHGNHPFGAVLADSDNRLLLSAENTVVTAADATGHAETNLVRLASSAYSLAQLRTFTLYTTTEPCAMCSAATYWVGIGTVVYALAESDLREMTGADVRNPTLALPCRDVFAAGSRPVNVYGPYELAEARDVHAGFWHPQN